MFAFVVVVGADFRESVSDHFSEEVSVYNFQTALLFIAELPRLNAVQKFGADHRFEQQDSSS